VNIDSWLAEQKIPRAAYRVVMLMPLVYVAWADGAIQNKERKLILQIAGERGLLENGGREALEHWLSAAPTATQLKSNVAILNELSRSDASMTSELDADGLILLLDWCQDVADAAGGMLGLVSARRDSERAALKIIASSLDIRNAKNWQASLS
jgi:hypothetical protein